MVYGACAANAHALCNNCTHAYHHHHHHHGKALEIKLGGGRWVLPGTLRAARTRGRPKIKIRIERRSQRLKLHTPPGAVEPLGTWWVVAAVAHQSSSTSDVTNANRCNNRCCACRPAGSAASQAPATGCDQVYCRPQAPQTTLYKVPQPACGTQSGKSRGSQTTQTAF